LSRTRRPTYTQPERQRRIRRCAALREQRSRIDRNWAAAARFCCGATWLTFCSSRRESTTTTSGQRSVQRSSARIRVARRRPAPSSMRTPPPWIW
jgi:hypothetical protein